MVRDHSGKLRMLQQELVAGTRPRAAPACWKTCTSTARQSFFPQPLTNTAAKQLIQTAALNTRIQRSPLEEKQMGTPGDIHRAFSHRAFWICNTGIATSSDP
jgi:hypothetical protein